MVPQLKHLFFLVVFISYANRGWPQHKVFPVQTSIQLLPPYSLFLPDYAAEDERLKVHLFLRDLSKAEYPVRLRIRIEGFGITATSKNSFYAPPIILNGGHSRVVAGLDLLPYLHPQNLVFQGLDMRAFQQNGGKLPEGVYRISVEVLDYYRREVVSNEGTTVVSVFLSYPPIVNLPAANSKIQTANPQYLIFQWTPRHTASLNAAFQVAYRLRLVEVNPLNRDPNDAMRSARPLFETVTPHTQFLYGMGEPLLVPGNKYALQVQAVENEGKDIFVNQGYSEVVPFVYGEKCSTPGNVLARLEDQNSIRVTWTAMPDQHQFTIRYREANSEEASWFEQDVFAAEYVIRGLKPGRTYEYQLGADCGFGLGEYGKTREFEMPNASFTTGDFVCGDNEPNRKIDPDNLLTTFSPYTVFYAAGFPVLVTNISQIGGKFTGEGEVVLPFLKNLRFDVAFEGIQINMDHQLVSGTVKVRKQTLDQSIAEVSAAVHLKPNPDGTVQAVASHGLPNIIDIALPEPVILPVFDRQSKTITFAGRTASGDTKEIKVLLTDGQPPVVFQDRNGQTFEVDEQGEVTAKGRVPQSEIFAGGGLTTKALRTNKVEVRFKSDPSQRYGFDLFQQEFVGKDSYTRHYQQLAEGETKKFISWKSIESGRGDIVHAEVQAKEKGIDLSQVVFVNATGDTLASDWQGETVKINVWGAPEGNDKEINAFYSTGKEKKSTVLVGKLNLASYQKLKKQVVIVPVNGQGGGLERAAIQEYLNQVYRQAVVEWEVTLDPATLAARWDQDGDGLLEAGTSSSMSAYTKEQKALASLYQQQNPFKDGVYYIFLVNKFSDPEQKGYMVRNGQVGFVASDADMLRSIAHELGHGAFALQHSWETLGEETKGTTQNLMDYSGGTELWHFQWKYMRNPDIIFRPFEGDDEGAVKVVGSKEAKEFLEKLRSLVKAKKTFQFITDYTSRFFTSNNVLIADYSLDRIEVSFVNLAATGPNIDLQKFLPIKRGVMEKGLLIGGALQILCKDEVQKQKLVDFLYGSDKRTREGLVIFANGFDVLKEFGSETTEATLNKIELVQSLIQKFQKGDIDRNREVTIKSTSNYWEGIDDAFMERIGYSQRLYVDGSYDMVTARNEAGFFVRLKGGEEAGKRIVQMLEKQSEVKLSSKQTPIDVVAHSMGFAYSLGVIRSLQNAGYKIGWVYSIAPENPSKGYVPNNIDGIWQYGTNENDGDLWFTHDQIAPQSAIRGLSSSQRVFIPNDGNVPRGILASHSIGNYKWIFNKSSSQDGYIKQRN